MDVLMPQLGETVAEGKIGKWFKSAGDEVKAGDDLFEIETDKVTMEVQATEGGFLQIFVAAGETVPVGTVVAVLGKKGEAVAAPKRAAAPVAKASVPAARAAVTPASAPAPRNGAPFVMKPFNEVNTPIGSYGRASSAGLKITPLARRLIRQSGVDLETIARDVRGRGGWKIAAADVKSARTAVAAPAVRIDVREGDTVETLNRIRAQTAAHLAASWRAVPHVFQAAEVDFSSVDKTRQAGKDSFAKRHGVTLTYLPFIARAVCVAVADFPRINAAFDGERLVVRGDVHLGIAVDLNHEGLVVPVVHHADEMTTAGLAKAIARQIEKARTGKLMPGDVDGGTYTITNNGSFGTLFTAPIINAPQVGILSMDAVRKRPVVVEAGGKENVAVRPIGVLGQSFDHRAFDGAYSAAFLKRLKEIIETRDWASELA
jgi:2-oxoglutarate dehydrogenase E2 component (dihydrolipoamide succinyltransferase)